MAPVLLTRPIEIELPAGFDVLRAETKAEGHDHIERLAREWESGLNRFDKNGEALLAAYADDVLAGIGGVTLDPIVPDALRMRRFYVRPAVRRFGVGRLLAMALLEQARLVAPLITLHAGSDDAAAFWERLGFVAEPGDGYSHRLMT